VRSALRCLLETEPTFKVVGESSNGSDALLQIPKINPDVLVVDLMLPDISGIELSQEILKRKKSLAIIILTMHNNETYLRTAMRAGVLGYILKDSLADELIEGIKEVTHRRHFLSKNLSELAFDGFIRDSDTKAQLDPYERLSARERETLFLTAQGLSRVEIAKRLFISVRTVDAHRANIMHKLGFQSHSELLRYAIERGISFSTKLPESG
jgi:DNA-binding NarL/FixJ family response regulator